MNCEALWNIVKSGLSALGEELQTTNGLWFRASSHDGKLYVDMATNNSPSSDLSMQRAISKKDFLFVHSYYDLWANGESGVRHEVNILLDNADEFDEIDYNNLKEAISVVSIFAAGASLASMFAGLLAPIGIIGLGMVGLIGAIAGRTAYWLKKFLVKRI